MGAIQELFSGPSPSECFGFTEDKETLELIKETQKLENDLLSALSPKERKVFEDIQQNRLEVLAAETERMFVFAFKMGFQLATEVFQE